MCGMGGGGGGGGGGTQLLNVQCCIDHIWRGELSPYPPPMYAYKCVELALCNVIMHSLLFLSFLPVTPRVLVSHAHPTRPVREGDTLSLVCEAYGLPTPEVTWLQMGSPVSIMFADNPRHTIETIVVEEFFVRSVLNISNVVPGLDEGEYKCRVDNFNISNQQVAASINISILGEQITVPFMVA